MGMKKKSFALSWGRKMFFGLGWALTSLVALNYFQSMIIPQTFVGWIYFLSTYVGHYGLILSLLYFLIYCPIVMIFPYYYVARFTSILLLVAANLFIFFDSYLFTRFRFHADSFLWKFFDDPNALNAFGLTPFKTGAIGLVASIVFVLLWIQGERIWRNMQTRFSNPVKNWYLVVILIALVISHSMYFVGQAKGSRYISRLQALFPVHLHFNGSEVLREKGWVTEVNGDEPQGYKDFYYPPQPLNCAMKEPKNILMIVMDKWSSSEFNEYLTPNLHHYASHGLVFQNHYSGGLNPEHGYFSLMYSVPPIYAGSAMNEGIEPAFISQMKKSKLDISFFKSGASTPGTRFLPNEPENPVMNIESHLAERDDLAAVTPFLMSVYLDSGSITEKDLQIKTIVDLFIKHKLIENTIVVLTGAFGDLKTPLIVIWPGRAPEQVQNLTSHYDVLPTIMKEDWRCKNKLSEYSFGKSLFATEPADVHIAGDYSLLKILNNKNQTITTIENSTDLNVRDMSSMELHNEKLDKEATLNALKDITLFYRRP